MDEEGKKKRKTLALKIEDFNSDGDMSLMVQNLRKLVKHEKQQEEKDKSEEKTSFIPMCYQYGNKDHIRPNFPPGKRPNTIRRNKRNLKKGQESLHRMGG